MTIHEILEMAGLAALTAGLLAMAVPAAIERFGGVLGGILGTLPSTIIPASIGIHAEALSHEAFVEAMSVVPVGMLLNVGFLFLWRVLPPRLKLEHPLGRIVVLSVSSLVLWLLAALVVTRGARLALDAGLNANLLAVGGIVAMVGWGAAACAKNPPAPRGTRSVALAVHLSRGVLAATAIAVAVWLASSGGPLAAGVASIFPAIFLTTMVALTMAQGSEVQAGAVGPMMLGSAAVGTYALLAAHLFDPLGPGWGAAVTWLGAAISTSLPAWWWVSRLSDERP